MLRSICREVKRACRVKGLVLLDREQKWYVDRVPSERRIERLVTFSTRTTTTPA